VFIDEARIRIKAGDGGNGCVAFRREKFVPRGGPSGGDGGHGGDIVMEASEDYNTLLHFRYNPEHKADRGRHGEGSNCTGRDGEDLVLKVPVGTVLYDEATGERVHDFAEPGDRAIIAKGGRGGRGNQNFATPTHQAPREFEYGRAGEERNYRLELKLLADVGLVGYPNVGKSTLISRISAAKPKIADYPFTTLQPNLGVVTVGDTRDRQTYVVADIPGLIEGAHEGHGLGIQFLRHIERTKMLLHLVDVSEGSGRPDPVKDFEVIMNELASFGAGLEQRPMIVVASKSDVADPKKLAELREYCRKRKAELLELSAVTGAGIPQLKNRLAEVLRRMNDVDFVPPGIQPLAAKRAAGRGVFRAAKSAPRRAGLKKSVARKSAAKKSAAGKSAKSASAAKSKRKAITRAVAGGKSARKKRSSAGEKSTPRWKRAPAKTAARRKARSK